MAKIDKVQEVAVSKLVPYEKNAKVHGAEQIEKLQASIEEFGFLTPCLIDKDMNIIAGHGRVMAAKAIGMETVPCVFIEGLTETQRKAYVLADNRLGELGEWDMDLVSEELQKLSGEGFNIDVTGFTAEDQIIDNAEIEELDVGVDLADADKKERRTKSGDIWVLGSHRLMVGDSTNYGDVSKLCGSEAVDMLETDPPYNVAIKNSNGDTIANDDMADSEFAAFLNEAFKNAFTVMKAGAAFYIWHADSNGRIFRNSCEESGLKIRQNLVWVKNSFTLGRQDYQWRHEPCLYGWKDGAGHYFSEKRNISTIIKSKEEFSEMSKDELVDYIYSILDRSTVFFEDKPMSDDLHPTMKPVSLIERQIKNSTRQGEIVLDLFGGSGTTLVACEKLGRRCFMMEYDPKYADVIIDRWESITDKKAVLLNG